MYARWALLLVATKGVGALGRIVDPQLPGFTSSHPFAPSDPEYVTFLRNVALPGLIFSALVAMAYVSYLFRLVLCSCCAGEKSEPEAPSASSRCAHVLIVLQLLCFSLVTGALVVALSGSSQFTETTDSMFTGVSAIAGRFVAPSQRVASRFVQVQRNVSAAGDDYEPIAAGLGSQVEAVQGLASSLQNATLQLDAAKSSVEEYNDARAVILVGTFAFALLVTSLALVAAACRAPTASSCAVLLAAPPLVLVGIVYAVHMAGAVATSDLCLNPPKFVAGVTPPNFQGDVSYLLTCTAKVDGRTVPLANTTLGRMDAGVVDMRGDLQEAIERLDNKPDKSEKEKESLAALRRADTAAAGLEVSVETLGSCVPVRTAFDDVENALCGPGYVAMVSIVASSVLTAIGLGLSVVLAHKAAEFHSTKAYDPLHDD